MNTVETIGKLITSEQYKDAIHMAIAPVVSDGHYNPGEHVGIMPNGRAGIDCKTIGVIDPFLKEAVRPGERCWLFLYPRSITGLRHEWEHPSFQNSIPIAHAVASVSEKWLREFAQSVDADYDEMMSVAETHCESGSAWGERYLIQGGKWEGQDTPDEFWEHFTNVTGKNPKSEYGLPGIFSCSC